MISVGSLGKQKLAMLTLFMAYSPVFSYWKEKPMEKAWWRGLENAGWSLKNWLWGQAMDCTIRKGIWKAGEIHEKTGDLCWQVTIVQTQWGWERKSRNRHDSAFWSRWKYWFFFFFLLAGIWQGQFMSGFSALNTGPFCLGRRLDWFFLQAGAQRAFIVAWNANVKPLGPDPSTLWRGSRK